MYIFQTKQENSLSSKQKSTSPNKPQTQLHPTKLIHTKLNSTPRLHQTKIINTKPNSTTPNQTHPYQTELDHTKPNSSIPVQTRPHQTNIIHTKPNSSTSYFKGLDSLLLLVILCGEHGNF